MKYNIFYAIMSILFGCFVIYNKHIGLWGHRFDLSNGYMYFIMGGIMITVGLGLIINTVRKK